MKKRTYSELQLYRTFEARFDYLQIGAIVGVATFDHERYLNQRFYSSQEWRRIRSVVIARDLGCDLGLMDHEIWDAPIIHHMNPIAPEDIYEFNPEILDPEYLITVRHETHNALHFGSRDNLRYHWVERTPGDTTLW